MTKKEKREIIEMVKRAGEERKKDIEFTTEFVSTHKIEK